MQPWVWLTAYVVGFGLLQILLYRHFSGRTTANTTEGPVDRSGGGHTAAPTDTDAVPCQHCGTVNESHRMVRYCRGCAESLR
jgi:hypothetical protein